MADPPSDYSAPAGRACITTLTKEVTQALSRRRRGWRRFNGAATNLRRGNSPRNVDSWKLINFNGANSLRRTHDSQGIPKLLDDRVRPGPRRRLHSPGIANGGYIEREVLSTLLETNHNRQYVSNTFGFAMRTTAHLARADRRLSHVRPEPPPARWASKPAIAGVAQGGRAPGRAP